mgnify:CR=1 FL=1|jgi:hypothetical protein
MVTLRIPSSLVSLVLCLAALIAFAPDSGAQKVASSRRSFPASGVEFKPLADMTDVPSNDRMKSLGVIGQFSVEKSVQVKLESGDRIMYTPSCTVVRLDPRAAETGEEGEEIMDDRGPRSVEDVVNALFGNLGEINLEKAEASTPKLYKGMDCDRFEIETSQRTNAGPLPIIVDVFSFNMSDFKIICAWDYPADKKNRKTWESVVVKSMKTFREMKMGADGVELDDVNSESSYEELLEFHTHDVEQTPGWRLVETKTKQYLIKTNVEKKDKGDIDEVIQRIEASRRLYEEDFPPAQPITSVSVIRLCATQEEFNTYGQTGAGVAGFFNPRSEELVLYFGDGGRDMTLSVMTHEGFHQYCHFLFNRSEAHRWFDEGHGDYYGAWDMRGKKLVPNEDMKGGLARIPIIKEMFKAGTIKPLSEHIRYDHRTWQSQGPSNVSCYAQSFSLIRFLREGTRGKVKGKMWKKEYAEILPNYMKSLNDGYAAAYAEIVATSEKSLEEEEGGKEPSPKTIIEIEKRIASPWDYLGPAVKQQIWDKAMAASWGLVDEAEFEENWLKFIDDVL